MRTTFDAAKAISAAVAAMNPPPRPTYTTGRSGLPVELGVATKADSGSKHMGMVNVHVKIDGTVDAHDADHLVSFFTLLSSRLKAADAGAEA